MIALLLAAAVAGQPVVRDPPANPGVTPPLVDRMPNAFHEPARCGSVVAREVRRQHVALHDRIPAAQYAVLRQLDGCMVPTPVGYHPSYLLPGAADAPPKPADGPANRR